MRNKVKVIIIIDDKKYEKELDYDVDLLDVITIGDILDVVEARKELKKELNEPLCPFFDFCRLASNKCYGINVLFCNIFREKYHDFFDKLRQIIDMALSKKGECK